MVVWLLVRYTYKCSLQQHADTKSNVYEALFMDVTNEDIRYKVTIGNIYRPPKSNNDYRNVSIFLEEIHPVIDKLDKEKSILVLGGDFNINLLEINKKEKFQDFFDMLISRGISPSITLPTRFSNRSATLIDNIFCKIPDNSKTNCVSGIFIGKLSDHLPIFTCLDVFKSNKQRTKYVSIQEKSANAIENFSNFIQSSVNDILFDENLISDPNENYNKLESILTQGSDRFFPMRQKRFNKYKHKLNPWITKGIMQSMKFRDRLYKKT